VQTHADSRVDIPKPRQAPVRHDAVAFRTFRIAHDATGANIRASWKWNRRLLRADHGLRRRDRTDGIAQAQVVERNLPPEPPRRASAIKIDTSDLLKSDDATPLGVNVQASS